MKITLMNVLAIVLIWAMAAVALPSGMIYRQRVSGKLS